MNGMSDASSQKFHAIYARWSELRAQLGPNASHNPEFVSLTQMLQNVARSKAGGAVPGQFVSQGNINGGNGNGAGNNRGQQSVGAGQMPGNHMQSQSGFMNPQLSQMRDQLNSNMMSHSQTTMQAGMSDVMGGMGSGIPGQMSINTMGNQQLNRVGNQMNPMNKSMSSSMPSRMSSRIGAQPPTRMNNSASMTANQPMMNSSGNTAQMRQMNNQMGSVPQMNPINPISQMNSMNQMDQLNGMGMMSRNVNLNSNQSLHHLDHIPNQINSSINNQMAMRMGPGGLNGINGPNGANASVGPMMSNQMPNLSGLPNTMTSMPGMSNQMPGAGNDINSGAQGNSMNMDSMHMHMGNQSAQHPGLQGRQGMRDQPQADISGRQHYVGYLPNQNQVPTQEQPLQRRKSQARGSNQEPKRKQAKTQQMRQAQQQQQQNQQQQTQEQQRVQMQQLVQGGKKQQQLQHVRDQQQEHDKQQVQPLQNKTHSANADNKDGMIWLNQDELGGDLDLDTAHNFFGDNNGQGEDFMYPNMDDDNRFLDVLGDLPEGSVSNTTNLHQGGPLSEDQSKSQFQNQFLTSQQSSFQNTGQQVYHGNQPTFGESMSANSPNSGQQNNSPQSLLRRTSLDHAGSLFQSSPKLSHGTYSSQAGHQQSQLQPQTQPQQVQQQLSSQKPGANIQPNNVPMVKTPSNTQANQQIIKKPTQDEPKKDVQLLSPDEVLIMSHQDMAFKALRNGHQIPDTVKNVLFNLKGPTAQLPQMSQFRKRARTVIEDEMFDRRGIKKGIHNSQLQPKSGNLDVSPAQGVAVGNHQKPSEHQFKLATDVMGSGENSSQIDTQIQGGLAPHNIPSPSARQNTHENRLYKSEMSSNITQSAHQEVKKAHLNQQQMDHELNVKRIKQQQWEAQQRQEEIFKERYTSGDTDDRAFVVPGGINLSTSNRSRRLNSSSESDSGKIDKSVDTDMLSRLGFDRVVNPYSVIPKSIKFEDLPQHGEMLNIPCLLPMGVCAQDMRLMRRRKIADIVSARLKELEMRKLSTKLSIDEEIELRRLRLEPYILAVRGDLLSNIQYFNSVAIDRSNRVHFARMKLLTHHDAALVERFVNEQAFERRKTENMGQHLYLQRVIRRSNDMQSFEGKKKTMRHNFVSKLLEYHQNTEKEERKRYERTAKQRLQLLRANDEEAYLKLIDQTKDARITHLLKQTNKFLAGLAKAVKDQQGEEQDVEDIGKLDEEEEDVREKVDYYEVAHRVKEQVTEQPSMLVGGKLKEYQIKGLQWMVSLYNNNLNGILADEMGLGKTIQSISLIAYLIEVKKVKGPFLVLVPLSTITNWNMEFDSWAPSINKIVYRGTPASRKVLQPRIKAGDFQVLLTTYEYVIKERPTFSRIKWEHMIIDEGHRMKNSQSKLSSTLAQYYTSKYRLILTGTPLQNNLPELWALLNFVLPKIFSSVKSFEEWFNKPFSQAGSSDRMNLGEEEKLLIIRRLHKVLRPFLLRRLKKDVEQDLPDKVEKVVKCKKSALQAQLYRQLLEHNAFALGTGSSGIRSLSNRVMQLRKLCNHPFVFEEVEKLVNPGGFNNDLLWRVSGKFELLDRILPKFQATNHRTLMFFQMTQIMDIMEDYLRLRGIQYLRLDGTTKAETRSELLKLFNEPDSPYFCFLLSTRAGGLGLNLQTADTVIIYDTDWNPHQDLQAQDRAHRIGQTKEVRILRLITENSIEENILERAQGKLDIDGKVIQAGKFDNKSTNEEQEAFLRTLLEAEESKTDSKEDDEVEEFDDDEINSMLARSEEERIKFQEMDIARMEADAHKEYPRLFSEAELPVQYTTSHMDQKLSESTAKDLAVFYESGHHLRARRSGNNFDTEEEVSSRKRSKLLEDSPSPGLPTAAVKANAPPALPKPRTGRKGRPPRAVETLTPEAREQLTEVTRRIIKRMKAVTDEDGRHRIDLFLELPSKSHYPDYYKLIGLPMCVAIMVKRINAKYYQSFEQFGNDWRIIFRNARWYNAEGSIIYNDANTLEEAFERIYKQYTGMDPPAYVDVLGDQPEKLNLQRGLPTTGTSDTSVGAEHVQNSSKTISSNDTGNNSVVTTESSGGSGEAVSSSFGSSSQTL